MVDGKPSQRPSIYTYNIFIRTCASEDDTERALRVFARMKDTAVKPDSYTYCALLDACGKVAGRPALADEWSRKEVAQRLMAIEKDMAQSGVQHTSSSVTALMNVLGSEGMVDAVLQNLRACQDTDAPTRKRLLDAISYNTAINSCVQLKKFDEAWEVFMEMKSLGFKPDVFTYNILINACSYKKSVLTAFELVETMQKEGVSPDLITYNSLIKVICHHGNLESGLEVLRDMKDRGVQPDVATYNTLLAAASFQKRKEITEHLVEEMRLADVTPDTHTCSQVVSLYMRCGDLTEASEALHVLSSRMLKKTGTPPEKLEERSDDDNFDENIHDDHLEEVILSPKPGAQAIYTATLSGVMKGLEDASEVEKSPWATRLREQFSAWTCLPQQA